jgi:predicted amidophosphoribosyltransferase
MHVCPTCKSEIAASATVCRQCGTSQKTDSTWKPVTVDELRRRAGTRLATVALFFLIFGSMIGAAWFVFKAMSQLGH